MDTVDHILRNGKTPVESRSTFHEPQAAKYPTVKHTYIHRRASTQHKIAEIIVKYRLEESISGKEKKMIRRCALKQR